jgi:hypothetical protein
MANRKQQTDKEVAESVQRVAEANAAPATPKPKPSTKDFQLNKKAKAAIAAPLHPRALKDKVNRHIELMSAHDEARMQGQKAAEKASEIAAGYKAIDKPAISKDQKSKMKKQVVKVQAQRAQTYAPEAPKDPKRIKELMKRTVKPQSGREKPVNLKSPGGAVLKDSEGQSLKNYGDYSNWKRKSTDPKITRKGRK